MGRGVGSWPGSKSNYNQEVGEVAQLVKCLKYIHEEQSLLKKPGVVAYTAALGRQRQGHASQQSNQMMSSRFYLKT